MDQYYRYLWSKISLPIGNTYNIYTIIQIKWRLELEIPEIEIEYPESLKGEMCRNVFLISKVFQNYLYLKDATLSLELGQLFTAFFRG